MYHQIQTLEYHIEPQTLGSITLWRLRVPHTWRERANALASQRRRGESAAAPVVSLNRAVQYLLPDQVVTVHRNAWRLDRDDYWITAVAPVRPDLLTRIVASWLRQAFLGDGEQLAARLDPADLAWEGPVSPSWEAGVGFLNDHDYWFNLLPYVVTTRLAQAGQLHWGEQQFKVRRVADETQSGDMVSWPPQLFGKYPWSLCLRFRLVTFADLDARLHLHLGLRLWEESLSRKPNGAFDLDAGRRTLYLVRDGAWLDGKPQVPVFVPMRIKQSWTGGPTGWQSVTQWDDSLTVAVISDLSLCPLPDLGEILESLPRARQDGIGGFVAALVHPPQDKGHRVRPGTGVLDRKALFESISDVVPFLIPVEPSPRNRLGNATKRNRLRKWDEITAEVRRDAVLNTLGGPAAIRVFYQTTATLQAVSEALHRDFGGAVSVEPIPLGELGQPLSPSDRSRDAVWAAVKRRSEEVVESVQRGAHGAVVELAWDRQQGKSMCNDPKPAIRLGLAKAGMVSQFLVPPEEHEVVTAENERVKAAVRDLMRQLGVQLNWPRPVLQDDVLTGTSLLGLVTIQKNADAKGRRQHSKVYLPVMVWMNTSNTRLLVHYPGAPEWVTYKEAAVQLAGKADSNWYEYKAKLNLWLQDRLLDVLKMGRALLMVDAYRTRKWWAWLANNTVTMDELKFGERERMWKPVHDPVWSNLRVVRILPGDSGETAQWFGVGDGEAGISTGLFQLSARTFVSAQELPSSTQGFLKAGHSKLDHLRKQGWLPRLMEAAVLLNGPGEDPAQWAAVAHHLRIMASHHREALMLPLPLHLAQGLGEYLLPVPGDESEE